MDGFILSLLQQALLSDNRGFIVYLEHAKAISLFRLNSPRKSVYYGFEWLVHSTVAAYLIEKGSAISISDLSIGTIRNNAKKPDIGFNYRGNEIVIEFKTIHSNDFNQCRSDVAKLQNFSGRKYITVCAYRNGHDNPPNIYGIQYVDEFNINDDFRVVLMSVI